MDEKSLFLAALEIEDETAREQFLAEKCQGNSALLAEVLSLLSAHRESADFLKSGEGPLASLEQTLVSDVTSASSPGMHSAVKQLLGPSNNPRAIGSLGHYSVLEVLGQGAFGIVLRAFDEKLHRVVAIKVLNPEVAATSPPRKRFLREARSAAAVKHENVVQVYSVEEHPIPYLVMEFIDGPTLQQRLDNTGPLDIAEVTKLSFQIASGLAAAHAKGLIHRDIKPGNILIEEGVEPKVKITDFGLARAADDASMTRTGVIAGTPMYMAPEQAKGQELDHRADLFSLGSVMYQMVSGRPPFRAENSVAVLLRVVNDTPRSILEIQPDVPKWFTAIVSKLHEKRPEQRFQSAQEVAEVLSKRLAEIADGEKIDSHVFSSQTRGPINTRFPILLAALVGVLLLGGLAAWKVWDGLNPETPANKIAAWTERVSKLRANEQVDEFISEMKRRNPKWDGKVKPFISADDQVWDVTFDWLNIIDISPIACFQHLKSLRALSSEPNAVLTDISPLSQCKCLEVVYLHNCSKLRDLSPLRELPIQGVVISATDVSDLEPLRGKPLHQFSAKNCRELKDISALHGAPLNVELDLSHSGVADFSELRNSKVTTLFCTPDQLSQNWETVANWPVAAIRCFAPLPQVMIKKLAQLKTLKEIDFIPLDQYLGKHSPSLRNDWYFPAGTPEPLITPATPEDAKRIQSDWAKFKNVPVETESSIGLKFAVIPPGEFQKTFHPLRADEEDPLAPTRSFRITYPYAMATTEVTVGQFRRFVEATGYKTEAEVCGFALGFDMQRLADKSWSSPPWKTLEDHPVMFVTDKDATEFCKWLSQKDSATYRLPTEAEWLHASRGGSKATFVFGDTSKSLYGYVHSLDDHDNNPSVAPFARVGRLKPNSLGLRDVLGNVWERTTNSIANPMLANYLPMENPNGGPNSSINGWSWADRRERMSLECYGQLALPHMAVGFRVLREIEPPSFNTWTSQALVLQPGAQLSPTTNVNSPTPIEGVRSWTVEVLAKSMGGSIRKRPTTDGYYTETDGHNGRINLWSSKLNLEGFLFGHDAWINDFTFSPDGKWLVSNTGENAFLWNAETKQIHAIIGQLGSVWPPSFSSDSKQLAVIRDHCPAIIELETGRVNDLINVPTVDQLKWHPDGKSILFGTKTNPPHLLSVDLATSELRSLQNIAWRSDFAFSPDGKRLAIVSFAGEVQLLNATTFEVEHTFDETLAGRSYLGWSPKSDSFVVANETETFAFDVKSLRLLSKIPQSGGGFVVTGDGKSVISRGAGVLAVYDNSNGNLVSTPEGKAMFTRAAFCEKSNRIFSYAGSTLVTHDARSGDRLFQCQSSMQGLSPDGERLYFGLFTPILSIADSETGKVKFQLDHGANINEHPVWSPDSKRVCTGTVKGTVTVWSLDSGKVHWKVLGHSGNVWALAWSPNGKHIATIGEDKKLILWDATTGHIVSSSEFGDQVNYTPWLRILAFSPDSELLWLSRVDMSIGIRYDNGKLKTDDSLTLNSGGLAHLAPSKKNKGKVFTLTQPTGSFRICDMGGNFEVLKKRVESPIGASDDEQLFFLHSEHQSFVRPLDISTNTYTGTLCPIITGNHWVCISPDGHYKGSQDVEEVLVYVAMLEDGSQHTYTPKEFAEKFGWENDPSRVNLTPR